MAKNLFLFFLIIGKIAFSQNKIISGEIFYDNKPVSGASIYLKELKKGTISDENGYFIINNISKTKFSLIISFVGLESKKLSVDFKKNNVQDIGVIELFSNKDLDEIVVSGTLKPVTKLNSSVPVEVYNKNFFKSNPSASIFESIQNINGIRPQINCGVCNTGDIHINGQDGSNTMVLIDGLPIVSGLSTVYGLTGIPQSLIEKIEIIKGPTSATYGSEAIGGLINLITKLPEYSNKFSFDTFYSGWGEKNYDIGYKYKIGNKIESLLGVNYFNYSNPIDNNNDGFTDLTLQDRVSIFNKINFNKKSSIATRFVYEDRWGGQTNWSKIYRGSDKIYGESIYTSRWEVFGNHKFNNNLKFEFSINDHIQNSAYGTTLYKANQFIGFGQFLWNKSINSNDLTFGLALRYTLYDDNSTATFNENMLKNENDKVYLPGFFIQDELKLNDKNLLLLGVRYDYNSIYGNIITPRINYKWNSNDKTSTIRIGMGTGFRITNVFTEDHAALTGSREVVFLENIDPEKSKNINLNFIKNIYFKSGIIIDFDSSIFFTRFSNKIIPNYDFDPDKIIYQNLKGSSISKGGSLNINSTFSNGLRMNLGVTLIDSYTINNGVKEKPYLTETFHGNWRISYNISNINLKFDYTGNIIGSMLLPLLNSNDPRPQYSPTYSIQNIQITKSLINKYEFYIGLKNILNFTPDARSISRSFDPFDKKVVYDSNGKIEVNSENPYGLSFDTSYVYASNQGIRFFAGLRINLN